MYLPVHLTCPHCQAGVDLQLTIDANVIVPPTAGPDDKSPDAPTEVPFKPVE